MLKTHKKRTKMLSMAASTHSSLSLDSLLLVDLYLAPVGLQ